MRGLSQADLFFYVAFFLALVVAVFGLDASRRAPRWLSRGFLFSGLSVLILGVHHLLEAIYEGGLEAAPVAEYLEAVAAWLLFVAACAFFAAARSRDPQSNV